MGVRESIGKVVLWVVAVPMMFLVVVLAFGQQADEVAADATTTGTVTRHVSNTQGPTYLCRFAYTVDGTDYRAADDCSHDDTPVGSTVRVNYVEDDPAAGFLHGDKTWWDKAETAVTASAVIAVIGIAVFLFVRRSER